MNKPNETVKFNPNEEEISLESNNQTTLMESDPSKNIKKIDTIPQIVATIIGYLTTIQIGLNLLYSAILLPQLADPTSQIPITKSEASWIASLLTISMVIGSIAGGVFTDRYGRKKLIIASCFPFVIGWILIATTSGVLQIYLARIISGFGNGMAILVLVYVSEISHPLLRPVLLNMNSVFVSMGILMCSIFGLFLEWRGISILNAILAVITFFLILLVPESPYWIMNFQPGENSKFEKSVNWIYRDENIQDTQRQLILASKREVNESKLTEPVSSNILNDIKKPRVYKPLSILLVIFTLQQFTGGYIVIIYATNIFLRIGVNFGGLDEYDALLFLGIIRFIVSVIAAIASQKVGRRILLILSCIGIFISCLIAGFVLGFKTNVNIQNIEVILLACVLGLVCFSSLGYFIIPWTLIGELLPIEVKGILSGWVVAYAYLLMFATIKVFPFAMDWVGMDKIFYTFAMASFVSIVFIFKFLPETRGRSFKEIEKYFE